MPTAPCDLCTTPCSCTAAGCCARDAAEPVAILPLQDGEILAHLDGETPVPVALRQYVNAGGPAFVIRFLSDGAGYRAGDISTFGFSSITVNHRLPDGWSPVLDAARARHAALMADDDPEPIVAPAAMVPQQVQQWQADAGAATARPAYTPGPWEIGSDDSMEGYPFIPISAGVCGTATWEEVAHVQSDMDDSGDFVITEGNRANARLIVAAPDLLASLRAMVDAYREGCADDDEPSMVVLALKAIAKAEGRQS